MANQTTVTTIAGDGWDSIAKRLWGDERLMHVLMQANPAHMDVLIFTADVVLVVPNLPRSSTSLNQIDLGLPPWM